MAALAILTLAALAALAIHEDQLVTSDISSDLTSDITSDLIADISSDLILARPKLWSALSAHVRTFGTVRKRSEKSPKQVFLLNLFNLI